MFFKKRDYFSQDGEDLFLSLILPSKKKGFYIDIGAAHPINFNNTYYFYKIGWHGLCVDASPNLAGLYKKHRPKDIFINSFVGEEKENQKLYIFDEPFLNTGSNERKEFLVNNTNYKLKNTLTVQAITLRQIFSQYLPPGEEVQIMSIDIEEGELAALESNNWDLYKPKNVILEVLMQNREKVGDKPSVQLLKKNGYKISAILPRSVIFSVS
jgi:hypothetical protein